MFTVLISYENIQHMIYFFPERADNVFYFGGFGCRLFFFTGTRKALHTWLQLM